jgi:3-oxoacyl-[acyl-carrier-protein] synthase II
MNTTFSFLDSVMDEGKDEHASPIHFSNSVHNSAAAHISILMKIEGPSLTVSQFEMSFPSALFTARRWLEEKRVDSVLLGGVDEFSSVLGYCDQRLFKKDDDSRIYPFAFNKQTAIPGGGTAFFVLTRDTQNDSKYCTIEDVQIGNLKNNTINIPENACLFIGADGNKVSGQKYPLVLNNTNTVAAYSPLYGSFPTATALDLAIAGISIKKGHIFASPEYSGGADSLRILKENQVNQGKICCLKICDHDEYSLITVN